MIAHDITLGKDFRLFFQVSYDAIVSLCWLHEITMIAEQRKFLTGCVGPLVAICYRQFLLFCNSCLYRYVMV
jgi:hypothetical protein